MQICASMFPRCSKILYYGPNGGDLDEGAIDGGGHDGVDINRLAISSQAHQVVTTHCKYGPLMFIKLIDRPTCDMKPIRFI